MTAEVDEQGGAPEGRGEEVDDSVSAGRPRDCLPTALRGPSSAGQEGELTQSLEDADGSRVVVDATSSLERLLNDCEPGECVGTRDVGER